MVTVDAVLQSFDRLESDRELKAAVARRLRGGVSYYRREIAARRADDMLIGQRNSCETAWRDNVSERRTPCLPVVEYIIVKPTCMQTAKHGGAGWRQRTWKIYPLRYAKGFLAVTDAGVETEKFPSIQTLKSAIKKSGWELVRQ